MNPVSFGEYFPISDNMSSSPWVLFLYLPEKKSYLKKFGCNVFPSQTISFSWVLFLDPIVFKTKIHQEWDLNKEFYLQEIAKEKTLHPNLLVLLWHNYNWIAILTDVSRQISKQKPRRAGKHALEKHRKNGPYKKRKI